MTCSIESAIISEAAPKKYARNTGCLSAGNETVAFTVRELGVRSTFAHAAFRTSCWSDRHSSVQLGIAAEDALLVERDAARGTEVRGEPPPRHDAIVERHELRILRFERCHRPGKGVAQAFDHLEERELDVGDGLAALEALEIVHELRQPLVAEVLRAAQ